MQEPTSSFWALQPYLQAVTAVSFTRTSCQLTRTKMKMWLWQLIFGFLHLLGFADQQKLQQKQRYDNRPGWGGKKTKLPTAAICWGLINKKMFYLWPELLGNCPFPPERHWWASSVKSWGKTKCRRNIFKSFHAILYCISSWHWVMKNLQAYLAFVSSEFILRHDSYS